MIAGRAGAGRMALVAILAVAAAAVAPGASFAQETPPEGRITGTVTSGTEGVTPQDVTVQLIVLEQSEVTEVEEAQLTDGAFAFTVPARATRTYVPSIRYQGVQYFGDPVILSAEEREATREILVFEATREAPDLQIVASVVTVLGIDRQRGQLFLQREDIVETPGDRVFIGDDTGVTLRIPAPDQTEEAVGANPEGTATLEGGVVSTTVPLRPDSLTSIVTRYLIRYDLDADSYLLRVTAPVASEQIEVRVPRGYIHRIEPLEGATRGEDVTMDGELEGQVLHTVVLDGLIDPGRGLLVDLVGLSGERQTHPLTERPGAAIGAGAAVLLITGAAMAVFRWRGVAA